MKLTFFHIVIMFLTMFLMEPFVALTHRYVMHGFGWKWHKDHHIIPEKKHWFEMNDLYAIIFGGFTFGLFVIAGGPGKTLWWVVLGMTVYGIIYAIVHDGLVHRRWPFKASVKNKYLRHLIAAHHLHHIVKGRDNAVSFGFLYAPPVDILRKRSKELHAAR